MEREIKELSAVDGYLNNIEINGVDFSYQEQA